MARYFGFEPTEEKPYFFISYNSENEDQVSEIVRELHNRNIPVWYDYGIPYDHNWAGIIAEKVHKCESVILFYTNDILKKKESFVMTEYEMARLYKKHVYVVFLEDVDMDQVPYDKVSWILELRRNQMIQGHHVDQDAIVKEISRAIGYTSHRKPVNQAEPTSLEQKGKMPDAPVVKQKVQEAVTESKYAALKAGEYTTFGTYPQGKNGEEAPIEWKVLKREGNKALLISKYLLDAKKYNEEYVGTTWAECTLRTWLNKEFLNKAFTSEEQRVILKEKHHTEDKVFLLSVKEAKELFGNDKERKGYATEYAKEQGAYVAGKTGCSWWWLRSPGFLQYIAACVHAGGSVREYGRDVDIGNVCVRPAIWINL